MKTLKLDLGDISENIDPSASMTNSSWHILSNVSLTLFEINGEQNLEGLLAKSWQKDKSGKIYTVHLRQDAFFHNGRNIIADDVIYSLNRKQKLWPDYELFHWIDTNSFEAIKKISNYTVEFHLKKSHDYFLYILALPGTGIVPKEQYDQDSQSQKTKLPILGGAYKIIDWQKNQSIELELYEKWFGKSSKSPKKVVIYYKKFFEYRERFLSGETNFMIDFRNSLARDQSKSFSEKYNQFSPKKNNIVFAYVNTAKGPFRSKDLRKVFAAVLRQYFIDQKNNNISIASEFYPETSYSHINATELPRLKDVKNEIKKLKDSPVVLKYLSVPRSNRDSQNMMLSYLKDYGFDVQNASFESHAKNKENRIKGEGYDFGFWAIPLTPGDPCLVYRLDFGKDDFYIPDANNNHMYNLIDSTVEARNQQDYLQKAKDINDYFNRELLIVPLYHMNQNIYSSKEFDLNHLPKWQFNIRFYHVQEANS